MLHISGFLGILQVHWYLSLFAWLLLFGHLENEATTTWINWDLLQKWDGGIWILKMDHVIRRPIWISCAIRDRLNEPYTWAREWYDCVCCFSMVEKRYEIPTSNVFWWKHSGIIDLLLDFTEHQSKRCRQKYFSNDYRSSSFGKNKFCPKEPNLGSPYVLGLVFRVKWLWNPFATENQ